MKTAYVDSSAIVAIAFNEPAGRSVARRLDEYEALISSNLLEAEVRAVFRRKELAFEPSVLSGIRWVQPLRPLSREIERALAAGYLRGADLWHLAAALYVADPQNADIGAELTFVTLDERQRIRALNLGFQT